MQDDGRNNGGGADWHASPAEAVLAAFASGKHGLSSAEAQARLARYGANRLPPLSRRGPLRRFLAQFNNLLLYVLLVAAAVTALLRQFTDAGVILAVCIANAIIGFIQEGRAERALLAIRGMLSPQARVMRDGHRLDLPAAALVPGDLVLLNAGDRVPADLRLVWVKNLQLQEAMLTGESVPVSKQPAAVAVDAALGDRTCMAYSGTLVTVGQGHGVVVATGAGTELGRISGMLAAVEPMETPLLRQMRVFARRLTGIILLLAVLLFIVGIGLWAYPLTDMFMAVVSLAVAAIPEGLPVILTIAMAIGVQRMAGRNAVIRRLPAVEALGSVSVICTDKTGTLTRNEMTVRAVVTAAHQYEVTGVGHQPHGEFLLHGEVVSAEHRPLLHEMVRAAALCNDAALVQNAAGDWEVAGDPMEGALLTIARKIGLEPTQERSAYPRTDVIPFDARHKFMITLHHDQRGAGVIYLKGAPEQVLELCTRQRVFDGSDQPLELPYWQARIESVAQAGQRVLAIAARPAAAHRELHLDSLGDGLILLGLFGLIDPPREEAITAIADCQSAGIRVKMITGDHAATALAIARQLGLANSERVLTGPEIARADSEELRALVLAVDVFARASPEHKLRLVEALQAQRHVVAMTGDGVNDAPALKRADVGIAMGRKGTEAAKEAANMVLADDNFASIANAVREGRTVYDNLKKAIMFLLPINGGESMSIIVAILLGVTLPITPLQILWVNMVSSIGLAMALAFEPTEPDVMQRPPRPPAEPLLTGFLVWRIGLVSVLFTAGIFGMFDWALRRGLGIAEARTIAVNTLVVMEVFYLFSVRYLRTASLSWRAARGTRAVLLAVMVVTLLQLVFTYAPFMAYFFDARPVAVHDGLAIIAVGVALLVLLELEKLLRQFLGRMRPAISNPRRN